MGKWEIADLAVGEARKTEGSKFYSHYINP